VPSATVRALFREAVDRVLAQEGVKVHVIVRGTTASKPNGRAEAEFSSDPRLFFWCFPKPKKDFPSPTALDLPRPPLNAGTRCWCWNGTTNTAATRGEAGRRLTFPAGRLAPRQAHLDATPGSASTSPPPSRWVSWGGERGSRRDGARGGRRGMLERNRSVRARPGCVALVMESHRVPGGVPSLQEDYGTAWLAAGGGGGWWVVGGGGGGGGGLGGLGTHGVKESCPSSATIPAHGVESGHVRADEYTTVREPGRARRPRPASTALARSCRNAPGLCSPPWGAPPPPPRTECPSRAQAQGETLGLGGRGSSLAFGEPGAGVAALRGGGVACCCLDPTDGQGM